MTVEEIQARLIAVSSEINKILHDAHKETGLVVTLETSNILTMQGGSFPVVQVKAHL